MAAAATRANEAERLRAAWAELKSQRKVRQRDAADLLGVSEGELLATGAGKSTLLKTLAGDIAPSRGRVVMNDRPLADWRAVLPQNAALAFGFTALETVLIGRYPHSQGAPQVHDCEVARAALARLDAADLEARIVTTLSGGELARVQLARVLAQVEGARYLLLDEPTASLDPAHQHLALRIAQDFAREHRVGVLAVLHDINLAAQYADRVVLLKQGHVLDDGTPADVLTPDALGNCFNVEATVLAHPRSDAPAS